MPVNTPHVDYATFTPVWKQMRDNLAGQRAIHTAGVTYLPKLFKESQENYDARKARAGFFNALGRTRQGLVGMLFRKKVTYKISAPGMKLLEDCTMRGHAFPIFARDTANESVGMGRAGILVDHPPQPVSENPLSLADVERLNLRPFMVPYPAESIINWDETFINNKTVLSLVVLQELAVIPDPQDEFARKTEVRYRVLDLAPASTDAGAPFVYRQRVFAMRAGKQEMLEGYPIYPKLNGAPMREIPFEFFGTDDTSPNVARPPLEDVSNVNISHYQTTADLEHGAHKTALPQPWIAGITPAIGPNGQPVKDATFYMGGGDAWAFPSADTTVGMLEYGGAGLGSLENRLTAKESHMAVLGARMLEEQKTGVESAETAGMHRSGEQSALASHADVLSKGFKRVLGWFDAWAGGPGTAECQVNKEFFARKMTPEELTALVSSWQQGAISEEELFDNLKQGEVIRDDKEFEAHKTEIDNGSPTLLAQSSIPPADDNNDNPPAKDDKTK